MPLKEPVLLGSLDLAIPEVDNGNFQVNKIGGNPDWISSDKNVERVECQICCRESSLVIQIYCPLGQNSGHRTLYLFCCTNHLCWNKSESWTVIRCQQNDDAGQQSSGDAFTEKATSNQGWLSTQDDWDDGIEMASDELCSATENLTLPPEHRLPCNTSVSIMDDDSNESNGGSLPVTAEPLRVTFAGQFPWKVDVKKTVALNSKPVFCPYYISVVEEPDTSNTAEDSSEHINSLVQGYQQHDGNPFYKTGASSSSGGGGGASNPESYEKSEVKHGDKTFYKFQKQLSKLPQQVVRYQWCGRPLLIRPLQEREIAPPCPNCKSARVFEFQLMPALVSCLKIQDVSVNDPPVEFGTVIVSSCRSSCWKDGDTSRLEHVIVQSDPDEHLFQA